jgi:hypothetical protein
MACRATVLVDVDDNTGHVVEERDHLIGAVDDERVRLARRLEDVRSGSRDPVVLEIAPRALDRVSMDLARMAVPAVDALAAASAAGWPSRRARCRASAAGTRRSPCRVREPTSFVVRNRLDRDIRDDSPGLSERHR